MMTLTFFNLVNDQLYSAKFNCQEMHLYSWHFTLKTYFLLCLYFWGKNAQYSVPTVENRH